MLQSLAKNATYKGRVPILDENFEDVPRLKTTHTTTAPAVVEPVVVSGELAEESTHELPDDGAIPDDQMIQFAKEKRERLRLGRMDSTDGMEADGSFIPLKSEDAGYGLSKDEKRESLSRLVRDDIEDDTDEHFADAVRATAWCTQAVVTRGVAAGGSGACFWGSA